MQYALCTMQVDSGSWIPDPTIPSMTVDSFVHCAMLCKVVVSSIVLVSKGAGDDFTRKHCKNYECCPMLLFIEGLEVFFTSTACDACDKYDLCDPRRCVHDGVHNACIHDSDC